DIKNTGRDEIQPENNCHELGGDSGAARRQFRHVVGAGDYTLHPIRRVAEQTRRNRFFPKNVHGGLLRAVDALLPNRARAARPQREQSRSRNQRPPPPERSPAQMASTAIWPKNEGRRTDARSAWCKIVVPCPACFRAYLNRARNSR